MNLPKALGALCSFALGGVLTVHAYTHPCMPLTNADLTALNANKTTAPWVDGYNKFIAGNPWPEPHTKLTYVMAGPFVEVGRTPDVNRNAFANDIKAVQGLALQWKFTGDTAYADKARDILLAWAGTHTTFSGAEPYLDAGDYIHRITLGASILRSYSGWTAANTTTVKNYLNNVWWPMSNMPNPLRSANQGTLQLKIAMGVAVYCDDTAKFDQTVAAFRTDACAGFPTTLPNGQIGDTGRDQGHAYGELTTRAWIAEIAWKAAGVDLYGELGNRLRTAGEYYANYNNGGSPAFIKAGTCYDIYPGIGAPSLATRIPDGLHLLRGAYVVRKGLSMPYLDAYLANQTDDWESWVYRKSSDSSTATAPIGVTWPLASAVTAGLTKTDIGGASPAGSATFSAGTWTVTGAGADYWGGVTSDSFTFVHKQVTGDATIIARVTGMQNTNASAKAGVMIRESLAADAKMAYMSLKPTSGVDVSARGYAMVSHNTRDRTDADAVIPYWVKVERLGNRINCYTSPDGSNWAPARSYEFSLGNTCYMGLAVLSHVNGTLNTSTFTNVAITNTIADGTYKLRNRASGKMLDNGGSTTDGTPVKQWTDGTSNNLKWIVSTTGAFRELQCVTGGKRLDSIGNAANDTPVGQWTNGTSANQEWSFVDLGNGYYKIINRANGLALDTGGATVDGAVMEFWASGTSINQQWQFVAP